MLKELQDMMGLTCESFQENGTTVNIGKIKAIVVNYTLRKFVIEIDGKKVESDCNCDKDFERRLKKGNAMNRAINGKKWVIGGCVVVCI